jgi:hypothetical protein
MNNEEIEFDEIPASVASQAGLTREMFPEGKKVPMHKVQAFWYQDSMRQTLDERAAAIENVENARTFRLRGTEMIDTKYLQLQADGIDRQKKYDLAVEQQRYETVIGQGDFDKAREIIEDSILLQDFEKEAMFEDILKREEEHHFNEILFKRDQVSETELEDAIKALQDEFRPTRMNDDKKIAYINSFGRRLDGIRDAKKRAYAEYQAQARKSYSFVYEGVLSFKDMHPDLLNETLVNLNKSGQRELYDNLRLAMDTRALAYEFMREHGDKGLGALKAEIKGRGFHDENQLKRYKMVEELEEQYFKRTYIDQDYAGLANDMGVAAFETIVGTKGLITDPDYLKMALNKNRGLSRQLGDEKGFVVDMFPKDEAKRIGAGWASMGRREQLDFAATVLESFAHEDDAREFFSQIGIANDDEEVYQIVELARIQSDGKDHTLSRLQRGLQTVKRDSVQKLFREQEDDFQTYFNEITKDTILSEARRTAVYNNLKALYMQERTDTGNSSFDKSVVMKCFKQLNNFAMVKDTFLELPSAHTDVATIERKFNTLDFSHIEELYGDFENNEEAQRLYDKGILRFVGLEKPGHVLLYDTRQQKYVARKRDGMPYAVNVLDILEEDTYRYDIMDAPSKASQRFDKVGREVGKTFKSTMKGIGEVTTPNQPGFDQPLPQGDVDVPITF